MLKRYPKDETFKWSKVFKGVIYVEAVILVSSFYLYRKLCRDQNFRYRCYQNHGFILEGFYNMMDIVGYDQYRQVDYNTWGVPLDDTKTKNN
ncbi:unnamed protein product [Medioppia subpectinata]|uniref:Uncharacterized protein n=1 Tax=Medioppia subpectinata TaxID=1979941 RepID=A0A7R9Q945_9ACAR|nr:unnamed protein product [Medioppia subpectinata]CAG2116519.1 unnamed protein product [Medioppia subpectinata]